jgi:hypothetical protein
MLSGRLESALLFAMLTTLRFKPLAAFSPPAISTESMLSTSAAGLLRSRKRVHRAGAPGIAVSRSNGGDRQCLRDYSGAPHADCTLYDQHIAAVFLGCSA